jgi:hypothetical protein
MAGFLKHIFYILIVFVAGFFIGHHCLQKRPCSNDEVQSDTTIVFDTIRITEPQYIAKRIVDTMYVPVPVTDTLNLTDTVFVKLPREQKEYCDKEYNAWVSGYRPRLDSIDVFPQTMTITKKIISVKSRKWSLGIQSGYGATTNGTTVTLSPFIGIGISYDLISW